ncbi:unnamed protein product [Pylaiella littoralis]
MHACSRCDVCISIDLINVMGVIDMLFGSRRLMYISLGALVSVTPATAWYSVDSYRCTRIRQASTFVHVTTRHCTSLHGHCFVASYSPSGFFLSALCALCFMQQYGVLVLAV